MDVIVINIAAKTTQSEDGIDWEFIDKAREEFFWGVYLLLVLLKI